MKKITLLLALFAFTLVAKAAYPQTLPIDYNQFSAATAINTNGTDLVRATYAVYTDPIIANQWNNLTTGSISPTIENSTLSYSNYCDNSLGKAIVSGANKYGTYSLTSGSEYTGKPFYVSALINFSAFGSTAFFNFGRDYAGNYIRWRLWAVANGVGYSLGLQQVSETLTMGTTLLNKNQTYLVVLKFTPAATGNESLSLFVDPNIGGTEVTTTVEATLTAATALTKIQSLVFRTGPTGKIGGIRFSDNWADIVKPQAPTITSFTPSAGSGTTVTITGTNFLNASAVSFGGTSATSFTVASATSITAVVGSGTTGTISVTTPGGTGSSSGSFTFIPAPTITSFSPTTGGNGTTVTITGTNFTGATAVSFGGNAAASFNVANATSITAVVAAGSSGNVSVTTPGGTITSAGFNWVIDYNSFTTTGAINANGIDLVRDVYANVTSSPILANEWTTLSALVSPTLENSTLSYSNYFDNNLGKAVVFSQATPTRNNTFYPLTTSATTYTGKAFYLSTLINISSFRSGDAFLMFGNTIYGNYIRGKLQVVTNGTGYSLNVNSNSETGVAGAVGSTVLNLNQTYLVVFKITPTASGTETLSAYVNPTIGGTEGTPEATTTITSALFNIKGINLRATFMGKMAGMRFSDTWAEVVKGGATSVTSFSPIFGASGTLVTITGTGFTGATGVSIGGVAATSVVVNSDTQITATAGAGTTGTVSVTSPTGTGANDGFYYAPTITSFTATKAGNGATVTITGTNLTGATAVSFGGTAATSWSAASPTSIIAVVGAGATGSVSVSNPAGTGTKTGFTFGPSISGAVTATAFTTTYGTASAAQTFAVNGYSLTADLIATAPTGFEVSDNGTNYGTTAAFTPSSGTVSGSLRLRFKATAAVGGSYNALNIILSSTGATSLNIKTASSGNTVTAKTLTITATGPGKSYGTALITGTSASNFTTNGAEASGETVTGITLTPDEAGISAITAVGAGYVVTPSLATGTGGFLASNYNITYTAFSGIVATPAPTIASFTPTSAGNGTTVTITGTNLTGASAVSFGGTAATSFSVVDATSITAVVAAGTSGTISVTTPGGTATSASTFTFIAAPIEITTTNPTLASLNLNTASDITVKSTGTLTINAPITVNSIALDSVGTIKVVSGNAVGVSTLTLKAGKTTSFSAKIDETITANTVRFLKTMDDKKWYFMSFPCNIVVADIISLNGALGSYGSGGSWFIKEYNGFQRANSGTTTTNWSHVLSTATLTAYKGYIFGLADNMGTKELIFPLTTNVLTKASELNTVPVEAYTGLAGGNNYGWNLIGQPYLSKFIGSGASINYMTFSDGISDYTQCSKFSATKPLPSIDPFAAYFVQVDNNTAISFSLTSRQGAPALVSSNLSDIIDLNLSTATGTDITTLIMDNDQSTAYQIGQDLEKWIGTGTDKPQVYSILGGINYAFNALPMNSVTNLPIGFYTKNAGSTTISVNAAQAPSLSKLLLLDKSTGKTTDLLTSNYTFSAVIGTDNSRFVITAQRVPTSSVIDVDTDTNAPTLVINNSKLIINNFEGKASVRVFDAIGRMVANKTLINNSLEINLSAKGMYTVQIENAGRSWVKKIVN